MSGATWIEGSISDTTVPVGRHTVGGVPEPSSLILLGTVACVAAAVGLLRR